MSTSNEIRTLLQNHKTVAIVGGQFGDEGKGKFGDSLAEWADYIARGTGGANAGHTISFGGKEHIFHLIPSGILHDKDGKINIIGSGTAFDPGVVCQELELLKKERVSYNNLLLSPNSHLVLPQHLVMDRMMEQCEGRIGTTGRGIGPVYQDHYARIGLQLNDILNKDEFVRKLRSNLTNKLRFLKTFDLATVKAVMQHEHLLNGRFWSENEIFDVDAIIETYLGYAVKLRPMMWDTDAILRKEVGSKHILLEGAQANLLSIDAGTYPCVTASDCTVRGLTKGVGLRDRDVDLTLTVVKAFYMTRVGEGPFPTEIGGKESASWCAVKGVGKSVELDRFGPLSVNEAEEFKQGVGIRMAGKEYGATTGRPRRTGWLDLPLLQYSLRLSGGPDVILTKLDVLDECETIKICTGYQYDGPGYSLGNIKMEQGCYLDAFPQHRHLMENYLPIYRTFPGWLEPIRNIRSYEALPDKLESLLSFVSKTIHMRPRIISVGPDRDETIVVG